MKPLQSTLDRENMSEKRFKTGDLVMRRDNPTSVMCVESNCLDGSVLCSWWSPKGNEILRRSFATETLQIAPTTDQEHLDAIVNVLANFSL